MTNKPLSTCCRCLKKTDGIHTCTPSAGWRKLEERCDELLAALEEATDVVIGHYGAEGRLAKKCLAAIDCAKGGAA